MSDFSERRKYGTSKLPKLTYCEDNILYILENFKHCVDKKWIPLSSGKREVWDPYDKKTIITPVYEKYELVKNKRTVISDAKKEPYNLRKQHSTGKLLRPFWEYIDKPTFEQLIQVLYDYRDNQGDYCLTLWDNRLLYQNRPDAFFHINNHFYGNTQDYDLKRLAGVYRTFKNATSHNDTVLCGRLEIKYREDGNYLETCEITFNDRDLKGSEWTYYGTINYFHSEQFLIWQDVREHSEGLYSRCSYIYMPHLAEPDSNIKMFARMFQNMRRTVFDRLVIIDNEEADFELFSEPYTSEKIPEHYREQLRPSGIVENDTPEKCKEWVLKDRMQPTSIIKHTFPDY